MAEEIEMGFLEFLQSGIAALPGPLRPKLWPRRSPLKNLSNNATNARHQAGACSERRHTFGIKNDRERAASGPLDLSIITFGLFVQEAAQVGATTRGFSPSRLTRRANFRSSNDATLSQSR